MEFLKGLDKQWYVVAGIVLVALIALVMFVGGLGYFTPDETSECDTSFPLPPVEWFFGGMREYLPSGYERLLISIYLEYDEGIYFVFQFNNGNLARIPIIAMCKNADGLYEQPVLGEMEIVNPSAP